ncbi:MAG: esterase [Bryobacterales bacterium]|nr:esterase [Bryobacterales bacterium]
MKAYTLLLAATACFAQNVPNAADTLVSPEVHSDRKVTFRVLAPRASDVSFFGDWMPTNTREKMTRQQGGIWTVTLGPLPPSVYLYSFIVDGMMIADPVNPRIKLRARTSASMVEVPAETPAFWQIRDVPHGDVQINYQKSKALNGETRWIWIYTPPGYEKGNRRYPVLYLFHGSNDTAGGWVLAGHANFILDNLIAEKKAVPMIVVMPYGHAVPFGSPREVQAKNVTLYDEYIMKDVMPHVEAKYRVAPGKANRAIAGLSMGGGQSIHIGFNHLNLFSAIGAFSAAVPADFETRFSAALKDAKATNAQLKTLWIACGKDDFLIKRNQDFSALLKANQVRHTFELTEGAHTYTVWRRYLGEFVPLLFR